MWNVMITSQMLGVHNSSINHTKYTFNSILKKGSFIAQCCLTANSHHYKHFLWYYVTYSMTNVGNFIEISLFLQILLMKTDDVCKVTWPFSLNKWIVTDSQRKNSLPWHTLSFLLFSYLISAPPWIIHIYACIYTTWLKGLHTFDFTCLVKYLQKYLMKSSRTLRI